DTQPYLYRTTDYGATWALITDGIPHDDFTRVIREDPGRPGLLYAGTETGVYVSFDDGTSWRSLQRNLPAVPIYDLAVKEQDLVAATHGRSFWILDDLTSLHQWGEDVAPSAARLFAPRPAYRLVPPIHSGTPTGPGKNYMLALGYAATFTEATPAPGETVRTFLDAGANPPGGVIVTYYLGEEPRGEVTLRFKDPSGRLIRGFSSEPAEATKGAREPRVPKSSGMNRFVWNMRHADARGVPRDVRRQVEEWMRRAVGHTAEAQVTDAARRLIAALGAIEQELIEPRAQADGDRLHIPTRLNVKLDGLSSLASSADAAPTRQALEVFDDLRSEERRV